MCHEPLTDRIKSNFYIDDFIKDGWNIEYWDISQYIYPGIILSGQVNENYVIRLTSLEQIRVKLEQEDISNSIFVVEVIDRWSNRYFFKLLSDMQCYTVRIDMYGNTVLRMPFRDKLFHLGVRRIFKILNGRYESLQYKRFVTQNHVKGFDEIFSSSSLNSHRVPINHPDYEAYIKTKRVEKRDDFIVFLDVFFPLHPDFSHMVKVNGISAETLKTYRDSLNSFFKRIEDAYNLPIVIAAHPKADYTGEEFQNREIMKGGTADLVRKAAAVVLHSSNSVSYAILNDKPFELITNNDYCKVSYLNNVQKKLAWVLGKQIYNIDSLDRDIQFSKMDPQLRHAYIYSYLTSKQTKDRINKDIILSHFLSREKD